MWSFMDTTLVVVLLIGMSYIAAGFSTKNFTETGECQGEQVCIYHYVAEQQYFAGEGQQNNTVMSEVEIMCNSVGLYNGNDAALYCMTLQNTSISGSMLENADEREARYREEFLNQYFSGLFCFVQTVDGKIAEIYHSATERDEAINFKKAIAAAFQANFKGTEIEEEVDPQSIHRAHYQIDTSQEDGAIKMHRTITGDDVLAYPNDIPKQDIKLTKEEDIEYQSGKLRHSAGTTSVKVSKTDSEQDTKSFSNLFSAKGSYALDLVQCYSITNRAYARHRRSSGNEMETNGVEEGLQATLNKTKFDVNQMEQLRQQIPSVTDTLQQLRQNLQDRKIVGSLQLLLKLESKHGPLPGYRPALSDVLEYFSTIQDSPDPHDEEMRVVVYALLSAEGSYQSQMVLMDTLGLEMDTTSNGERIALINELAMIENPYVNFVLRLKEYLNLVSSDIDKAEPLLLSFAALASKASPEVEEIVVSFLLELEASIQDAELEDGLSPRITLIIAMGNTGSKRVVPSLLLYLKSSDKTLQLMAVTALQKLIFEGNVLDAIEEILSSGADEEILTTVTETLVRGLEYSSNIDMDTSFIAHHSILKTLVEVSLEFNDTEIQIQVQNLLKDIGGEQAYALLDQFHLLTKRGSNWNSGANSLYDLVASHSARTNDENSYPRHKAYIWGKRFGIDEANIEIAAGAFGGVSNDCDNIKGFGRAVAKGNLLSRSKTFTEVKLLLQKTGANLRAQVYVQLNGNTLVNYDRSYTASRCLPYNYQLYERRWTILEFSYPIFIYVGTIDLTVRMDGFVSADFDASICGSASVYELATATSGLTPRIGVSVQGEVSATLVEIVRGGVTADASFIYQLEPRASAKACGISCSLDYESCVGIYDSWPGNTLEIYAFYQFRSVDWCKGWFGIPYPCGFSWGSRNRWDAFSWSWSIGSSSRKALLETCRGSSNPQCSASPAGR